MSKKIKRADYIRSLSDEDLMMYIYRNSRCFSRGMKKLTEWLQEEIEVEETNEESTGCNYCKQGKSFNVISFGDVSIRSYILGDRLITDVSDGSFPEEEDGKQEKIINCPFCGAEVHPAPDEEMEEVQND